MDSVPVREWRECLHKAEPLAVAAGSRSGRRAGWTEPAPVPPELAARGRLREHSRQHGRPLRLADHLARLARSVRELYGLSCRLRSPVASVAASERRVGTALRVHVRTGHPGSVSVSRSGGPWAPGWTSCALALATRPELSWRHKWADRAALQAAEERTGPALPYFLDPARSVGRDQSGQFVRPRAATAGWRTPSSGEYQLPGVTRRALLDVLGDRGVAAEIAPLTARDLRRRGRCCGPAA